MPENTLSPVHGHQGFERIQTKVAFSPECRYALASLCAERDDRFDQDTVRAVVDAGLTALGWPEERRILEFAKFSAACVKAGEPNQFRTGR